MHSYNLPRILSRVNPFLAIRRHFSRGPKTVGIEISSVCNYRCPGCFHGISGTPERNRPRFMDHKKFERIIESISSFAHSIDITGNGEAFLNPQVYDMIRFASDHGILVFADTNGSHLDIDALLSSGIYQIRFALDGFSPYSYEEYRRQGNFQKVINTINDLSARAIEKSSDISIVVKFLINKLTEGEIVLAKHYFSTTPNIRFELENFIIPPPSYEFDLKYPKWTDTTNYKKWAPELPEYAGTYILALEDMYMPVAFRYPITGSCPEPEGGAFINTDGIVYPCCLAAYYELPETQYGCLWTQSSFMEVWDGPQAKTFRKEFKSSQGMFSLCGRCPAMFNRR